MNRVARESRRSGTTAGFVLLEALVALVLVALTMGLVVATLSFGQRVAAAGRPREQVARIAHGSDALAGWLAGAAPARPAKPSPSAPATVLFEGRADRLSFLTTSIGETQPAGLLAVTVGYTGPRKQGAAGAIVFAALPLGLGATDLPDQTAREVLIGDVVSARFSYFGSRAENDAAVWRDGWTSAGRLPRLVLLRAGVALGDRVETLELTFRVFAE